LIPSTTLGYVLLTPFKVFSNKILFRIYLKDVEETKILSFDDYKMDLLSNDTEDIR